MPIVGCKPMACPYHLFRCPEITLLDQIDDVVEAYLYFSKRHAHAGTATSTSCSPTRHDSSSAHSVRSVTLPHARRAMCPASPSVTGIVTLLDLTIPTDPLISGNPVWDGNDGSDMFFLGVFWMRL